MKYLFVILLLIILLTGFFFWSGIYFPKEAGSEEEVSFLVKKGEGAKEISVGLKEEGLIRFSSLFRIYVLLKGVPGELKAGEYLLSRKMNIPQMVDKFVSGERIKKEITIIEGWNLKDIAGYLEKEGIVRAEEFFQLAGSSSEKDFSQEFDFLKDRPEDLGLEGYLFPDTYEVLPGEELEEIIRKMLANFDKKLTPELREEISEKEKSIFEIITMASLLEREVRTLEDKKVVSGVLWKRLESSYPLQVDATITYITGKKTVKISEEETKIDSPYNTYKYKGLPLGPISNPGLESVRAAISPKDSPYFFYLSTPEGETIFSKTLKEHNIAKAKYLK